MTQTLALSEQLRVALALTGRLHFDLDRDQAIRLIRAIEAFERVEGLRAAVILSMKDQIERSERQWRHLTWQACWLAYAIAAMALILNLGW